MEGHQGEGQPNEGLRGAELGLCVSLLPGDLTFLPANGQSSRILMRPSLVSAPLSPGGDKSHLSPAQLALISSAGGLWRLAKAMAS